jgi:hypothetical protein
VGTAPHAIVQRDVKLTTRSLLEASPPPLCPLRRRVCPMLPLLHVCLCMQHDSLCVRAMPRRLCLTQSRAAACSAASTRCEERLGWGLIQLSLACVLQQAARQALPNHTLHPSLAACCYCLLLCVTRSRTQSQ